MNYELAKELKDAGFPQETQWVYVDVGREWPPSLILRQPAYGGGIPTAAPTLEELIFAVDDLKFTILHDKDGWYAENEKGLSPSDCKSPEEAVAQLWLTTR